MAGMIKLTDEKWKLIKEINSYWNDKITYMSDIEHYGKEEHWAFPVDDLGDCEDIAIAKRCDLLKNNIESRFATCWTETDGYHAVLIVHTDKGDFVLDNRYDDVMKFEDLPYRWEKIETEDGVWKQIIA